ncbi:MAG: hypothetical protein HOP12_12920 [Candidatus Eisenbacteria bacterium]|uniref:Aconitase/3-isopropylmalate dehydratase large subunit alpha/beta/alpha domain-containing protein n=1 Tax=Eiseniibacteriota bacterium TaxID=2212470 RepID=A0A849SH25_UNCEI|nr:hypothetical protein [Candidatus Eisenbacteria bacterium]
MNPWASVALIAAHRSERRPRAAGEGIPVGGERVLVTPDHLVLDEERAGLVALGCRSLGLSRATAVPTFAVLEREGPRGGEEAMRDQRDIELAAERHGLTLARPGAGETGGLALARLAAPARMLAGPLAQLGRCGALATLIEEVDALDAVGLIAGTPLRVAAPRPLAVRLLGKLSDWTSGFDLAAALMRHPRLALSSRVTLEWRGADLASLPVSERIAAADAFAVRGWRVLFPSDERTREWLALEGRETDWRALTFDGDGSLDELEFDAGVLEPMLWLNLDAAAVEARGFSGAPIEGVWVGPRATVEDLARLVTRMGGRPRAESLRFVVVMGTRRVRDTLAACGLLAALEAAGAELHAYSPHEAPQTRGGRWLMCAGEGGWGACGPDTIAASAVLGRLADPRELDAAELPPPLAAGWRASGPLERRLEDARLIRAGAANPAAEVSVAPALPLGPPLEAALRAVLIADLDHLPEEGWIRWGPRALGVRLRPEALALHVLAIQLPGFAERARAAGSGCIRVRGAIGESAHSLDEAIALRSVGVRVILATGYAAAARHALASLGILALECAGSWSVPTLGHELELPDLPHALEPRKPIVCRDLTHGRQFTLRHAHDALEIDDLRAGGRLARFARETGEALERTGTL